MNAVRKSLDTDNSVVDSDATVASTAVAGSVATVASTAVAGSAATVASTGVAAGLQPPSPAPWWRAQQLPQAAP